jgi:aerobic carbon-monoxide dehydrogenase medium subunit
MKPAPFSYARPKTIDAALALLAEPGADSKIIAGGQSLVPMMNFRLAQPARLIDINRLPGGDYIRVEGGELAIGFLARHEDVKQSDAAASACPLMHGAYEYVAHGPVRNRGTLCGNLCHADPASEMPAVMLAVGATFVLRSAKGERRVAALDFFLGLYETATRADEMLVEVRVPIAAKGQGWGFHEVSTRKGDFAMTCVAALLNVTGGKISAAAVAAAGVSSKALRLPAVEALLVGAAPSDNLFAQAGTAARKEVEPTEDALASAEYRRDLLEALTTRALADAAKRAN